MNPRSIFSGSALGFLLLCSVEGAVILGNAGDATYSVHRGRGADYDGGTQGTVQVNGITTDAVLQVGQVGTNLTAAIGTAIIPFVLPTLNPGETFSSVSFSIGQTSASNAQQYDLYGLGRRDSVAVSPTDYYRGATGRDLTDATLIQASFISTTDVFAINGITSTNAAGNTALADYLNLQYASGAGIGGTVFLRLNVTDTYSFGDTRLNPAAVENATASLRPMIHYTAVPEPTSPGFLMLAAAGALIPRKGKFRR